MSKLQVKKSNFLVPLEESVSKPAQLLASYIVASLPKSKIESDDLPQLSFPYVELRRAINADGKERVNKVQDVMDLGIELQKCVLFYEDNESERTVSWLIDQERSKRDNVFTYSLHPSLKKYLINIENHFTRYNYLFRVCLNAHAMKLYEILKMYQFRGEVTMNINEDIKPSLGLIDKYPKVYDFKRRVLNVAQKEIRKYTDIRFEYEVEEKKGKTPISFRFIIYSNQPTDLPPKLLDKFKAEGRDISPILKVQANTSTKLFPELHEELKGWGGKEKNINLLLEQYGVDAIKYQIAHLKRNLRSGKKIDLPFAWFTKALKEDYKDTVQERKQQKDIKKNKIKQKVIQKQQLEENLKVLEQTYYKRLREQSDFLLKKQPFILKETIERLKDTSIIRRALQKGRTNEEIYTDVWTTWTIQKHIQEMYPDVFKEVKDTYLPQVEKLKKQLTIL